MNQQGEQYIKITHKMWTTRQLDRMKAIMDETIACGKSRVGWKDYQHELGHTLAAIRQVAARIYHDRYIAQQREVNRTIRAIVNPPIIAPPIKPKAIKSASLPAIGPAGDSHLVATSTQSLSFAADMRNRLDGVSITAGLLGDPPPGRSALDRRLLEGRT